MREGWVYITTNRPNGTLYTGVTSDLIRRIWQHKNNVTGGFTERHDLKRLVYFENHAAIETAIQREKNIKHWSRAWKVQLILAQNPHWADLYDSLMLAWAVLMPKCLGFRPFTLTVR